MNGNSRPSFDLFSLRKELLEKDGMDILLGNFFLESDENELWELLRRTLIAIRLNIREQPAQEESVIRSIEHLYALTRFIQINRRFPSKREQGSLLSGEIDKSLTMSRILDLESNSPKSQSLRRRQREAALKNTVGIE